MSSLEKLDAQLVGIGQIVKATRFSVPIYQRPYSWTDIEVDELCSVSVVECFETAEVAGYRRLWPIWC